MKRGVLTKDFSKSTSHIPFSIFFFKIFMLNVIAIIKSPQMIMGDLDSHYINLL